MLSPRRRFRSCSSKIIRLAADNVDADHFFSLDWVAPSTGLLVATDSRALGRFEGFVLSGLISDLTPLNLSPPPPVGCDCEDGSSFKDLGVRQRTTFSAPSSLFSPDDFQVSSPAPPVVP